MYSWRKASISQALILFRTGTGLFWPMVVVMVGLGLWIYSYSVSAPAFDEIFSAVHTASYHPFQALSYYMLPNNHILFNVLNSIMFPSFDKVVSGRIISLISYLGILLSVFYWFRVWMAKSKYALLATVLVSVQLPVLGFSAQARGYELQLLAGWIAFINLYKYYESNKPLNLKWHCLACIVGYATIPPFLYFHAAILAFAALQQLYHKKADFIFWKYQVITCVLVFLFYQPAFCFSGLSSFSDNPTVKGSEDSLTQFLPGFIDKFRYFISFCFSFVLGEDNVVNYILFLLPLGLCFSKNRMCRMMGVFYALVWVSFILIVLYFKKIPFSRNLIIQYSITQGLVVFTLYRVLNGLSQRLQATWISSALFSAISLLLTVHYLFRFHKDGGHLLYFNSVNEIYQSFSFAKTLPKQGSIAFSDESFYVYYLCRKHHYDVSRCCTGNELFYIKIKGETLPPVVELNYYLEQTLPNDYELYKRQTPITSGRR
jgi:hypothetical protein